MSLKQETRPYLKWFIVRADRTLLLPSIIPLLIFTGLGVIFGIFLCSVAQKHKGYRLP